MEATRVFLSYVVVMVNPTEGVPLADIAVAVVAAIAIGGLLARVVGLRAALSIGLLGLVIARLVLQFSAVPQLRLITGAIVVIAWGWLLPVLRLRSPDDATRGVVFGLFLDLAVRYGFGSVDLPWMPNAWRSGTTVCIVAVMLGCWLRIQASAWLPVTGGGGPSLLAIGPGLAVFHLVTGNLGLLELRSSSDVRRATLISLAGLVIAMVVHFPRTSRRQYRFGSSFCSPSAVLTFSGIVAFAVFWHWDGIADVSLVIVAGASARLLMLAISGGVHPDGTLSLGREGIWLAVGILAQFGWIFAYYAASGHPIVVVIALFMCGVAAFLATGVGLAAQPRALERAPLWIPTATVVVMIAVFLVNRSAWDVVRREETLPGSIGVMTYNIQNGFSREDHWDLEATANAIEAEGSDIVILQEVSRGWAIGSGVDEAQWLSHRLQLNLAWGPTSHDGLWGVAILTRGTVKTSQVHIYETSKNWRRGVLAAEIATDDGSVFVYATHLDAARDADEIRLAQITQVIKHAEGKTPVIVGGDFNALPDSDVVAAMTKAGFANTGVALPVGSSTSSDGDRIDYLFVRGAASVDSITIPDVWASDHRPVHVQITLR